jgi:hypothetical protein
LSICDLRELGQGDALSRNNSVKIGSADVLVRRLWRLAKGIQPLFDRSLKSESFYLTVSRRDADWSDRDDRAPIFQLHGYGSVLRPPRAGIIRNCALDTNNAWRYVDYH